MMYSRIQGLEAGNSLTIHRYGVVGVKRVLPESKEGRLRSSHKNYAVKADSAVPEAMICSPHPDAVRRHREAEERCDQVESPLYHGMVVELVCILHILVSVA